MLVQDINRNKTKSKKKDKDIQGSNNRQQEENKNKSSNDELLNFKFEFSNIFILFSMMGLENKYFFSKFSSKNLKQNISSKEKILLKITIFLLY